MLHKLHWLYTYVASVCFKCFSCFKHMLQVFLSGCCICCDGYTRILQVYVLNVSFVLDVCCSKCFMLQVLHDQTRKVGANGGGPLMCAGSEAGVAAPHACTSARSRRSGPTCMHKRMCTVARGALGRQARQQQCAATIVAAERVDRCDSSVPTSGQELQHAMWGRPSKVGGGGAVHASPLAECIQGSASLASFSSACRGSALGAWTGIRRGRQTDATSERPGASLSLTCHECFCSIEKFCS
jgi:hypothetical protein